MADALGQRPLIIRTLDVGGDKPLPYLDLGHEENPFLGWRGIRFCLDRPAIFKPQLRAILRAGFERNVQIMFPMIGYSREIRKAKQLMEQAKEELRQEGLPFDADMPVGIMIEVPSAVAIADLLAKEVDFLQHRHQRSHPIYDGRRSRQQQRGGAGPSSASRPCCA